MPRRLLCTQRLSGRRLARVRVGLRVRVRVGVVAARVRSTAARVRCTAARVRVIVVRG